MHIKWLLSCLLFSTILLGQQSQPFQNEFFEFKKQDSIVKPPHRPIVFAGSSSFRLWKTIQSDFSGYPILNRGFGGATLLDLEVRLQESVLQYRPKQVFIYCGENDFASDGQVTPELVFDRFKRIFYLIRHKHKRVNIVFVSIKPSVARWTLESKFVAANQLIRTFLSTKPNTSFADVHQAMLDENGNVYANLFIQDNLHMNAKGYQIWSTLLRPYLLKE